MTAPQPTPDSRDKLGDVVSMALFDVPLSALPPEHNKLGPSWMTDRVFEIVDAVQAAGWRPCNGQHWIQAPEEEDEW